jgi:CrtC N-terminal lipocalin domain
MKMFVAAIASVVLGVSASHPAIAATAAAHDLRIAMTGDAAGADGHRLHYAMTVFRYVPHEANLPAQERVRATIFVATCTLTDETAQRHATAQRYGRAAYDDVTSSGDDADVAIGSWTLREKTAHGVTSLALAIDDANLHLRLAAHGVAGARMPFIPAMPTTGRIDGAAVRGRSTFAVDTLPELVDGTTAERMDAVVHITGALGAHTLRIMRLNDADAQTQVTMVDPDGRVTHFRPGDVRIESHGQNAWVSPDTPFT